VPERTVPGDEWVELIPETLEDDYSIIVKDAPVYLAPGDEPAVPVKGLPIQSGAIQSGELDRGIALWGRSQVDTPASVRVVPNIRIDGSNERAVTVSANVKTGSYPRGASFDTSTYPVTISPGETIQQLLLSIVGAEIAVEVTTTDGDVITLPVNSSAVIDSYDVESIQIQDPNNSGARVAGSWAGE
jgi:hypothetical protein